MKRRTVLVGIAATLAPRARAQTSGGGRRIGVLMSGVEGSAVAQTEGGALVAGLAALDWHEGKNLRIDWRWTAGEAALYESYAAELAALGPEVFVVAGSPSVAALRRRTTSIPIVFTLVTDPVGQGFVTSLAHPGSNITGFSEYDPPMAGKWLGILTQIDPPVSRVAVLHNPATAPYAGLMLRTIEQAALSLKLSVRAAPVRDDAEIDAMLAEFAREEHVGMLVLPDGFTAAHGPAIVALAAQHHVPAVYPLRLFADSGGLIYYGVDTNEPFRRAAGYVDRILKGAKPGDLPVQRPTKFELVINLKTATALGVTIAPALLATADEVIE